MVYTFQLSGKFKIHVLVQKIVYHVTIKIEYIVYFLIHFSDMVCHDTKNKIFGDSCDYEDSKHCRKITSPFKSLLNKSYYVKYY